MKLLTWSQLWFLAYLFLFSVVLLPALLRLARRVPSMVVPPAFIVYLPALVMAALLVAVHGYWPYLPNLVGDWGNVCYFGLCVMMGGGIAAWPGFEVRLRSEAPRLLVLMLLAFVGVVLSGESVTGRIFVGVMAWGATGAALGFAARHPPRVTATFRYLNEAALPVFIVHHAPLLLIGLAVLPLALPVAAKVAVIFCGAATVSLAAYHWLIRPWPPVRWLMGMSPRPPSAGVGVDAAPSGATAP
jgi:hypothetical protein